MTDRSLQPDELIEAACAGELDAADRDRLESLLAGDPAAVRRYARTMLLSVDLSWELGTRTPARPAGASIPVKPVMSPPRAKFRVPRPILAIAAVILLAACGIVIVAVALNHRPSPTDNRQPSAPLASVTDVVDGTLMIDGRIATAGEDHSGRTVSLDAGEAEFMLSNRVVVRLQGRSELAIVSPMRATLASGTAVFRCPPGTEGFTVHAPHGVRIVDLGTEFEATAIDGRLIVRVIEGEVEVRSGGDDAAAARFRRVAGQHVAFFEGSPMLDLADIVGGGDGTGTGRSAGVRLADGATVDTHRENVNHGGVVNRFVPAANPLIDGVFVPDGEGGRASIPVSSTGLSVTGIADSDGRSWDEVWNGLNAQTRTARTFDSVIAMHASKGVTFDLDAIRRAHPTLRIERFTTTASVDPQGDVTAYVVVDGVVRVGEALSAARSTAPIDLSLDVSDRFLTLMTLSNGVDTIDWALFEDARLSRAPADTSDNLEDPTARRPHGSIGPSESSESTLKGTTR